jgi:photosystem II stability/assembly factor-like uncharacterized protein
VTGTPDGSAPCAPKAGEYDATVQHPERAPLQAHAEFPDGVRWAICGADPTFSSDLLNLRSTDAGKTWTVTYTGFGMSPHHAGDAVAVQLTDENRGSVHLVSWVATSNDIYNTADGGRTWRHVCSVDSPQQLPRCPASRLDRPG